MSYCIYGLRLKGDAECRYIGLTSKQPEQRLASHFGVAFPMPRRTNFAWWLVNNRDNIEAVKLAAVDTLAEAQTHERVFVLLCLRLGHRLFNRWHVPTHLRLPDYRVELAEQEAA